MSSPSGFLTDGQRELMRSASQGRDVIPEEKKVARTNSHGHSLPDVPGSVDKHAKSGAKLVSGGSGEVKKDRHSHSGKNGRAKKGDARVLVVEVLHSISTILLYLLASCDSPSQHRNILKSPVVLNLYSLYCLSCEYLCD